MITALCLTPGRSDKASFNLVLVVSLVRSVMRHNGFIIAVFVRMGSVWPANLISVRGEKEKTKKQKQASRQQKPLWMVAMS